MAQLTTKVEIPRCVDRWNQTITSALARAQGKGDSVCFKQECLYEHDDESVDPDSGIPESSRVLTTAYIVTIDHATDGATDMAET